MFLEAFVILMFFFVSLKFLGLWEEKPYFFEIFAKAYSTYNIYVRHFAFGQCRVYIVSNKRAKYFFIFSFFYNFISKNIFFVNLINPFFLKLGATFQKSTWDFYRGIFPKQNSIYFRIL